MKIIVVGDALIKSDTFIEAAKIIYPNEKLDIKVFEWFSDLEKDQFQDKIKDIETRGPETQDIPEGILEELVDADLLMLHYAPVSRAMIECMPEGSMIGLCRGGHENVNVEKCREHNIKVIHVIRNAQPVAEFTVALMLAESRNIIRSHESIVNGGWQKDFDNNDYRKSLSNMVIGLIGYGFIGSKVTKIIESFGSEILVYDPYIKKSKLEDTSAKLVDLDTLLKNSDIVSLHARVSEETKNMIGKAEFNKMKDSAILVNTARPDLIDEKSLIEALEEKIIMGAALDVFWQEPLPANHKLLTLDNVTLTTHIAGDTLEAIPLSPLLLAKEIKDYLDTGKEEMLIVG